MEKLRRCYFWVVMLSVFSCNDNVTEGPSAPTLQPLGPTTPTLQPLETPAKIVFSREDTIFGNTSVWGMQPDGTDQFELISDGRHPVWAPNGRSICVTHGVDIARLRLITPDGLHHDELGLGDFSSWSPDSRKLAFNRDEELRILDIKTRQEKVLGPAGLPIWSQGGEVTQILENRCLGLGSCDLYLVTVGNSDEQLILAGGIYLGLSSPLPLSPDGHRLLVTTCFDGASCVEVLDLRDMSVRMLAAGGQDASWSPDGSKIAYTIETTTADRIAGLYVVSIDGGEAIPLVVSLRAPRFPSWSPEGRRIVFSWPDQTLTEWVWVVNTDGTKLTRLTKGFSPQWSPAIFGLI